MTLPNWDHKGRGGKYYTLYPCRETHSYQGKMWMFNKSWMRWMLIVMVMSMKRTKDTGCFVCCSKNVGCWCAEEVVYIKFWLSSFKLLSEMSDIAIPIEQVYYSCSYHFFHPVTYLESCACNYIIEYILLTVTILLPYHWFLSILFLCIRCVKIFTEY